VRRSRDHSFSDRIKKLSRLLLLISMLILLSRDGHCSPSPLGEDGSLIPRQILFGNPDKTSVKISPDGSRISYLAPVNGVLNLWVAPVGDPLRARPVTNDTNRGIRSYAWAYNNQLLYLQDRDGDELWRLFKVDLNQSRSEAESLTPKGSLAAIQKVSHNFPDEILVILNERDPRYFDIYRINLKSGNRTLLQENPGFGGFITDDHFQVRLALNLTADGGAEYLVPRNGSWERILRLDSEDYSPYLSGPIGMDKTGRLLYFTDNRERDTAALKALDLDGGQETLLAEDPKADASAVLIHPRDNTIQAVAFTYDRAHWKILDPSIEEDMDRLKEVSDGEMEVVSRSLDDKAWIVSYLRDNGPGHYYYYNRKSEEARFLFTWNRELEDKPLARMHSVIIKSRDGLDLMSYCTLPLESDPDGDGHPNRPLPLVLLVHGGPWLRDNWGYNPIHQWLANRGYAVLSINFRGSTGFGKSFMNAGNLEWGGKMQDDLIDGANWAVAEGIADPDRIAIMGGSYGGYATLAALTMTPEAFACGVDLVGPSNLITFLESVPAYWEPLTGLFRIRIGDNTTEEGRAFLEARSPINHAENVTRPLLIGQGANDPRVRQNESEQIVSSLEKRGTPVTYLVFPDEGHGFARPENNMAFFAVTEAFLAQHLGGEFGPIGSDFQQSSITVPVGAEAVPGLQEALEARDETSAGP